jgi:hypothetical protein
VPAGPPGIAGTSALELLAGHHADRQEAAARLDALRLLDHHPLYEPHGDADRSLRSQNRHFSNRFGTPKYAGDSCRRGDRVGIVFDSA